MAVLKKGSSGIEVVELQRKLARLGHILKDDGDFGKDTETAVRLVQAELGVKDDGIVGSATWSAINSKVILSKAKLVESDFQWAATYLDCDIAAVKAVRQVEAPMGGFLADSRVTILYERHIMVRQLKAYGVDATKYITSSPDIVNTRPGGYLGKAAEYLRLEQAINIHELAALESCSWGAYQIMGFHYKRLGFNDVKALVTQMDASERGQLECFVKFIKTDANLTKAIRNKDWATFAKYYNGANYQINKYDIKLATAYAKFAGK